MRGTLGFSSQQMGWNLREDSLSLCHLSSSVSFEGRTDSCLCLPARNSPLGHLGTSVTCGDPSHTLICQRLGSQATYQQLSLPRCSLPLVFTKKCIFFSVWRDRVRTCVHRGQRTVFQHVSAGMELSISGMTANFFFI